MTNLISCRRCCCPEVTLSTAVAFSGSLPAPTTSTGRPGPASHHPVTLGVAASGGSKSRRLLPRPQGHSSRSSRPAQPPAAIVGKRLQAPPRAAHRCRPTTPAATPSRRRHAPDPPHHHAVACARDSAPRIWLHAREGQGTRENRGMGIPGGDGIGRNQFGGGRDGGSTVGCWRSGRIGRKSGEGEGDQGVGPSGDGEGASILHVPGAAP
ncbi:hypothetical protein BRADI_3g33626v3 [Brachypodium distachyon]|uniref:Uncharacterized protein n=1 Tax=Brachypodium distachyon TaxID=15368 RepID=A0A2K2D0V6_BRADI|nr:hypothetical protein BRADI_3g33626v3 [Brachypodium distachyon]